MWIASSELTAGKPNPLRFAAEAEAAWLEQKRRAADQLSRIVAADSAAAVPTPEEVAERAAKGMRQLGEHNTFRDAAHRVMHNQRLFLMENADGGGGGCNWGCVLLSAKRAMRFRCLSGGPCLIF